MFNKPRKLELDYLVPRRRARWPGVLVLLVSLTLAGTLFARWRDAVRSPPFESNEAVLFRR